MIPSVDITKLDGQTGVVRPGPDGVLAIIAPCQQGTQNQAATFTRADLALTEFGTGILTDAGAYVMAVAGNPVVLIRSIATTVGIYGAVTHTGAGTSVVTAGVSVPLDDYDVFVRFPKGGTIGVAGITYQYSLDGGQTMSGEIALGTATTIAIPNSGAGLALAAGTILAGQTEAVKTTGPRMTNADLVTALEALRVASVPWEAVCILGMDGDATSFATLDLWLTAREAEGKFRTGLLNSRMKNVAETESAYLTAMATAWSGSAGIRTVVGTDGGDQPSTLRGIVQRRPEILGVAARGMAFDISVDPARVSDGPVQGVTITDARGNPKHHNEALFPGLDDLRLSSYRTFDGREGVFVNNAPILSPSGSDYVFWQHARVVNRGCEVAFQILTAQLSQGFRKDLKTGFIFEEEAQAIEGLVNTALEAALNGRVSGFRFVLSRTDDLSSNAGATLSGEIQISALAYAKKFKVQTRFVRRITAQAA